MSSSTQDISHLPLEHQMYLRHNQEEQDHFDDVCRAFQQYAMFAQSHWINQRSRLEQLPESQQRFLPDTLKKDTFDAKKRAAQHRDAAIRNQFCFDCMLRHAGKPHSQEVAPSIAAQRVSSDEHMSKVFSVLKSLARDWSAEGKEERDTSYGPLLKCIQQYLPPTGCDGSPPKICVPGAGVGRLMLELAAMGYTVQGNEFSLFMLLASDWMLNGNMCTTSHPMQISPWLLESRNVNEANDPFRTVKVPDIDPPSTLARGPNQSTREFSMAAGDFVTIYSNEKEHGQWDGIVSCFFLDTAPSIVEYLLVMFNMLREGGFLINHGPLLHHWSGPTMRPDDHSFKDYQDRFQYMDRRFLQSVDLCWEDVRRILTNVGFVIEQESVGIPSLYTADHKSMMRLSYRCVQFVARKPSSVVHQAPTESVT